MAQADGIDDTGVIVFVDDGHIVPAQQARPGHGVR